MSKKIGLLVLLVSMVLSAHAQRRGSDGNLLSPVPPMGWMTWNFFADKIQERDIREMADAMVSSGMRDVGYRYVFIDDGWQGGRDARNNIIPDPAKFPSGIKALADYVHARGLKLGIYSDAAQLTCAGYTGSLHFEEQDARVFASWGIDYLKYDYCHAPADSVTARVRYQAMAAALSASGRDIELGICEWGDRQPWNWAAAAGGQLWRISGDVRDKWKSLQPYEEAHQLHRLGAGILDIADIALQLPDASGPGRWNDLDMLVVGLYGKKGPSGDLGGSGCSDTEYQSQMSLWCLLNSPLAASNDLRSMSEATRNILLNREVIALNQDTLGVPAALKWKDSVWNVLVKPLAGGDFAVGILNRSDTRQPFTLNFKEIGLPGTWAMRDLWLHETLGTGRSWRGDIAAHEVRLLRLKRVP
ncbi:MAG: glycoside hydrolase family 27 protein [Haliscomenobacter sp.]